MEAEKVSTFLGMYGDKLPLESYGIIKERLMNIEDHTSVSFAFSQFKDPTIALVLSILLPGIDRIYIGDIGLGVLKLLTCGGLYIWWIIDIFLIMKATKKKNLERLMMLG